MNQLILFLLFMIMYYAGKYYGVKKGIKQQQDRDEHIMHTSLCERNSPSIRVTWRCIAGETTLEEMREELAELNPVKEEQ